MLSRPVPESKKTVIKINQPTCLKTLLEQNTKNILEKFSADEIIFFNKSISAVKKSIQLNNVLNVNDKAPDLNLQLVSGGQKKLSEYYSKTPVVLMWFWGNWSSYCDISFSAYKDVYSQIKKKHGELIIVTPEKNVNSIESLKNENIEIVVDTKNQTARKFGLVFAVPAGIKKFFGIKDEITQLPLPAVYIIDTQGVIRYAFLSSDLKHRADPLDVLNALKQINSR